MRVLLVEDEVVTTRALCLFLKADCGAVVDTVDTGEEALEMARHYDYDAILLDLMLPDMDGLDVLRRLRAAAQSIPVLVLTGLSRPQAKVAAFNAGADDVMTKPFDRAELVARVKAIVRRSKGHSQSALQVGPMLLNLDTTEVSVDGSPVHLTGKEYAILELLTLRRGMVLTKEAFLNHLYGGLDEPEMKIIDVFICKLRKKLAAAGAPNLIGTVWGRGYIMREPDAAPARSPAHAPAAAPVRSLEEILLPGACEAQDDRRRHARRSQGPGQRLRAAAAARHQPAAATPPALSPDPWPHRPSTGRRACATSWPRPRGTSASPSAQGAHTRPPCHSQGSSGSTQSSHRSGRHSTHSDAQRAGAMGPSRQHSGRQTKADPPATGLRLGLSVLLLVPRWTSNAYSFRDP